MLSLLTRLIPSRYENREMLKFYVETQYGPYLKKNRTESFEPFYEEMTAIAREYIGPETRALDIGCGTGRLTFEFARLGAASSCGTETSGVFLRFCERLKRNEIKDVAYPIPDAPVTFLEDDICASELPDASFDFVACLNIIDRVRDPAAVLTTMERLISPGGIALIADPYDWKLSPAPESAHVSDIKDLLSADVWDIESERRLLYRVPTGKATHRDFDCHLVVARKKP